MKGLVRQMRNRYWCVSLAGLLAAIAAGAAAGQLVVPGAGNASAQQAASTPAQTGNIAFSADLPGSTKWKDTGVDLAPGDSVEITASGQLQYADARQAAGPEGLSRGWKDLTRILPVNDAGRGALLARIGDTDASRPFAVGARMQFAAPVAGRLFLGINQTSNDQGEGSFHVEVRILQHATGAEAAQLALGATVPGFTRALLDKIPRRVADAQGDPGDMTNFILIGSEEQLRKAFDRAGWVLVDRTKKEAVLHGLLASLSKDAYVQMPMSELYLFGRPQDFGFAMAVPYEVALQRHHNRVWKSPYTLDGQTVWVGAGTHDIGLERDERSNGITHKIDADIDKEREFIAQSLSSTGLIAARTYLLPSQPVGETHTATGGSFHSDGRVLVMALRGASAGPASSTSFGTVFCSVLEREHPDAGEWGGCEDYLDGASARRVALGAIPTNYRLAVVPGLLSECMSMAPTFKEGREHLRSAHGMTVDLIPAPNRSSAENGRAIAAFLKQNYAKDGRKFIVLGYSKGAPDVMEGLAADPEAASTVAAIITVAGAIGGSPIADLLGSQVGQWMKILGKIDCTGNLSAAIGSLRRDVRRSFLSQHPDAGVPVYSLATASDRSDTSKALLECWTLLSVFGGREDSLLEVKDELYPGGKTLGTARADHWAVALPLENSAGGGGLEKFVDHNHFPRTALLEALVRYVIRDLNSAGTAPNSSGH